VSSEQGEQIQSDQADDDGSILGTHPTDQQWQIHQRQQDRRPETNTPDRRAKRNAAVPNQRCRRVSDKARLLSMIWSECAHQLVTV